MNVFKSLKRSKCEHTFRFCRKNEAWQFVPENIFILYFVEYQIDIIV